MWDELAEAEREQAIRALLSASVHVHRQRFAGKHEQDRADSLAWQDEHWALMAKLKRLRRAASRVRGRSSVSA